MLTDVSREPSQAITPAVSVPKLRSGSPVSVT